MRSPPPPQTPPIPKLCEKIASQGHDSVLGFSLCHKLFLPLSSAFPYLARSFSKATTLLWFFIFFSLKTVPRTAVTALPLVLPGFMHRPRGLDIDQDFVYLTILFSSYLLSVDFLLSVLKVVFLPLFVPFFASNKVPPGRSHFHLTRRAFRNLDLTKSGPLPPLSACFCSQLKTVVYLPRTFLSLVVHS